MTVILGDCLEVMASMEAESIDALVCDPPYGLEFMGKEWDRLEPARQRWAGTEKKTFGKGGSERFHNSPPLPTLAQARNPRCRTCQHYKFSGTPCRCEKPDFDHRHMGNEQQAFHAEWATAALRVAKPGAYLLAFGGTRTFHRLACAIEDAGWIIRDCLVWAYAQGFPKSRANLKPAWEPIVMARKPGPLRELAIDACRIPGDEDGSRNRPPSRLGSDTTYAQDEWTRTAIVQRQDTTGLGRWPSNVMLSPDAPIFDGGWDGVVGGGVAQGAVSNGKRLGNGYGEGYGAMSQEPGYGDTGTYSRFFLIPKASRGDREPLLPGTLPLVEVKGYPPTVLVCECGERWKPPENGGLLKCNHPREMYRWEPMPKAPGKRENTHPTVKPLELMRHLVRLVTPQGGTVLDPFLGSGTTALAAEQEGFAWVGIEREPEYVAIAEARLALVQRGLGI